MSDLPFAEVILKLGHDVNGTLKTKVRFRAAPHWSQSRLSRHSAQTNPYCYANMVIPSWLDNSWIHTKDIATKSVAGLQPQKAVKQILNH